MADSESLLRERIAFLERENRRLADLDIWSGRQEAMILERACALVADLRVRWRGRRHVMLDELRPLTAILDEYPSDPASLTESAHEPNDHQS